jgi:hypothetical protein
MHDRSACVGECFQEGGTRQTIPRLDCRRELTGEDLVKIRGQGVAVALLSVEQVCTVYGRWLNRRHRTVSVIVHAPVYSGVLSFFFFPISVHYHQMFDSC